MSADDLTRALIAYSYIRFSTKDQVNSHSLQRQWEMTMAYCQRRGWTLSTANYRDLGVSARRGKNALVGNLGEFLKAVESGAVQPGSVLIVESLDRVTRQGIDGGWELIKKILKAGIILVTLAPEREYDVRATKSLSQGALEIQFMLEQAAIENEKRAERVQKAWAEKKRRAQSGKTQITTDKVPAGSTMLTSRIPSWLKWVDGRAVVIAEKKAIVRRIFSLAINGYGIGIITKKLNVDKVPVISTTKRSKNWSRTYVAQILGNRAVVGEYQPYSGNTMNRNRTKDGDPIKDYYPRIIDDHEWHAARKAIAGRLLRPGRPPKRGEVNLFAGLVKDARDGGPMQLRDRGPKNGDTMLVPYRAIHGMDGVTMMSFPFAVFEKAILQMLREVDPQEILPHERPTAKKSTVLEGRLGEIDSEIAKLKERLQAKYTDAIADVLERQVEQKKRLTEEYKVALQNEAVPVESAWKQCHDLIDALNKAPDKEEARVKLRGVLRRIVEGIWCLFVPRGIQRLAVVQIHFQEGEYRDYMILYRRSMSGAVGNHPACFYVDSQTGEEARKLGLSITDRDYGDLRTTEGVNDALEWLQHYPQNVIDMLLAKWGQVI